MKQTQRRRYRKYFEACLLILGPIPPIKSLRDIREQETYKIEAMAWWCETQNEQVTQKAAHRFWKAYRAWHTECVGPTRIKYEWVEITRNKYLTAVVRQVDGARREWHG